MMKKDDKVFLVTAGIVSAATITQSEQWRICRARVLGMNYGSQLLFKYGIFYWGWTKGDDGMTKEVHCVKHLLLYPLSVAVRWVHNRFV